MDLSAIRFSPDSVIIVSVHLIFSTRTYLAKYEVKTIPSLKVIKPDGTVVVQDARTEVAVRTPT